MISYIISGLGSYFWTSKIASQSSIPPSLMTLVWSLGPTRYPQTITRTLWQARPYVHQCTHTQKIFLKSHFPFLNWKSLNFHEIVPDFKSKLYPRLKIKSIQIHYVWKIDRFHYLCNLSIFSPGMILSYVRTYKIHLNCIANDSLVYKWYSNDYKCLFLN